MGHYKKEPTVETRHEPRRLKLAELIRDKGQERSRYHTVGLRIDGDEQLHKQGRKGGTSTDYVPRAFNPP